MEQNDLNLHTYKKGGGKGLLFLCTRSAVQATFVELFFGAFLCIANLELSSKFVGSDVTGTRIRIVLPTDSPAQACGVSQTARRQQFGVFPSRSVPALLASRSGQLTRPVLKSASDPPLRAVPALSVHRQVLPAPPVKKPSCGSALKVNNGPY